MKLEKDNNLIQLDVFLGLCNTAQEMIFKALRSDDTCHFLNVFWLEDDILDMTPIEQIFYIGNYINEIKKNNFCIELEAQKIISIPKKNKMYRVDFLVSTYTEIDDCGKDIEFLLKKPIAIELDGIKYHSSKKQVNYDYERENCLKLAGYDVVRFTGSQVYNNVFACLDKVCELIKMADKVEVK